ncbi:hypothetical protein ACL9RL_02170 [Plantibacter sp. Mn2098]|uniref:hypothetical protein n=1 Tax=Plantibacter sp. Mn2098 TaxID=3395266 RepID=UPI003BC3CAC7
MQIRTSGTLVVLGLLLAAAGLTGCSLFSDPDPVSTAISTPPDVDKGTDAPVAPEPTAKPEPVIVFVQLDGDATHVLLSGYVAGVIENGGTCSWSLVNGASTQTVEAEGLSDRAQTSCGVSQIDTASLTPGTWTATLTYSSDSQQSITSTPSTLEIP